MMWFLTSPLFSCGCLLLVLLLFFQSPERKRTSVDSKDGSSKRGSSTHSPTSARALVGKFCKVDSAAIAD